MFRSMPRIWDLRRQLRSRAETSAPPDAVTIEQLLREHWDTVGATVVGGAVQGTAVHPRHRFVRVGGVEALFRADPGWEGPHPPHHTVRFVDHLWQRGAPVPRILALTDGRLSLAWRDYTISLETLIAGTTADSTRIDVMPAAGESLGRVHLAAAGFDEQRSLKPVKDYVRPILDLAANRDGLEPRRPFRGLVDLIESSSASTLELDIPWLYCHGDVGCGNIIVDPNGDVSYIDFGQAAHMPALVDVIMPRFQWLMGDPDSDRGFLTAGEAAAFVSGYERTRRLSTAERTALPVIWAAYYAEFLSFLWVKWGDSRDRPPKDRFEISRRIDDLPGAALKMGEELAREF